MQSRPIIASAQVACDGGTCDLRLPIARSAIGKRLQACPCALRCRAVQARRAWRAAPAPDRSRRWLPCDPCVLADPDGDESPATAGAGPSPRKRGAPFLPVTQHMILYNKIRPTMARPDMQGGTCAPLRLSVRSLWPPF
jgi:hypothetical protein